MAYSDYQQQPQAAQKQSWLGAPYNRVLERGGVRGTTGPAMTPDQPLPEASQAPTGDPAPLPTNTRAQALDQVQQAYQGRMPGQMDALNNALTQFASPVGLNDPGLAPALRAGAGADQRSFERQRAALAETLGANGLGDSGAFNTQLQNIGQRVGEAGAQRDAGLVYDEMGNRRQALLSALGMDQQRYGLDNELGYRLAALEAQLNQSALAPFLTY